MRRDAHSGAPEDEDILIYILKSMTERLNKRAVSYSWVCGNGSAVLLEAVNEEEEKILKELK